MSRTKGALLRTSRVVHSALRVVEWRRPERYRESPPRTGGARPNSEHACLPYAPGPSVPPLIIAAGGSTNPPAMYGPL